MALPHSFEHQDNSPDEIMPLSRKDFLRRGAFSLGQGALNLVAFFRGSLPEPAGSQDEAGDLTLPSPEAVAVGPAPHCLAKSCGCFSCVDRCESGAITIAVGAGIHIDADRCTGCGNCTYVCPTTPKAVSLVRRAPVPATAASPEAEAAPDKEGE